MLPILDSFYLKNQKRSLVCNQKYQRKYNWRSLIWFALPLITLGSFAPINKATAQLTPDTSLGAESSVVNPNVVDGIDLITGGATRGSNLFHSFQDFNVDAGRGAYFSNPTGITDILTRVTGGNRSNIQGTLGVLGNANLFLINPNGIDFGPNASLDLRGGSFFGSTADSVLFDNFEFSASNPQPVPQLTINIPIGLRFRDNPGSITNQSVVQNINGDFFGLIVAPTKTFALLGGDVVFNNGTVLAAGGRVELGGLKQAGTVGLNADGSLSFPNGVTRADVTINNGSTVAVLGDGGGSIAINARNFDISGGSNLSAGILSGFGNPNAQAGDIVINTTDKFTITGNADSSTEISNLVQSSAIGNAGNVIINTKTLEGIGGFAIGSATFGQGNAGRVNVTATDKIFLQGLPELGSGFGSVVGAFATGSGNDVVIDTPSLTLENFAQIATSTTGSGNAGNIRIKASESVSINSGSIMQAATYASGNAGDIIIDADNADVVFNAARISTSVAGRSDDFGVDLIGTGLGGDIVINARSLSLQNSTQVLTNTTGIVGDKGLPNAGNINITTGSLFATDGSQLNSSTFGQGNAGNVIINAPNGTVSFQGTNNQGLPSAIFSNVETGGTGDGGNIDITAKSLSLTNGGQLNTFIRNGINTNPTDIPNAGNVKLNISDAIEISGASDILDPNGRYANSGIFSSVDLGSTGNAGDIEITTGSLFVKNGGVLSASTFGKGDAGNITINAPNGIVSFDGTEKRGLTTSAAFSTVETGGQGKGGDINITARSLSLTNGGQLNTLVRGTDGINLGGIGDAGNVKLNISDRIDIAGIGNFGIRSAIFSNVETGSTGNAGNIDITTGSLFVSDGGQLNSNTYSTGNAGNVTINAPNGIVSFDGKDSQGNPSAAFSSVEAASTGTGGDIIINANSLSLTNGAQLNTSVRNNLSTQPDRVIKAGNVQLNVNDRIDISGVSDIRQSNGVYSRSGIFSSVEQGAIGNAGNIDITTGSLFVTDGGQIFASTAGRGDAGNITITARDTVSFNGKDNIVGFPSAAFSTVEAGGVGKGGDINITARSLFLTNSGELNTFIRSGGKGNAGNVKLNIRDRINITGVDSGIFSNVLAGGTGNGGNIEIYKGSLFVSDGGQITASTSGDGNAGSIKIDAKSLFVNRGQLITNSEVDNRQAGNIEITTAKDIRLDNQALISATTKGGQGNIILNSRDLIMRRNSNIRTDATGTATGGNITIDTGNLVALENSDISANAEESFGGRVIINADAIFGTQFRENLTPESDITASSDLGPQFSGTVQIDTADVDPSQGLVELPENLTDPSNQIAQNPCQKGSGSSFIITGRGGLPSSPNNNFSSDNIRVDLLQPVNSSSNSQSATINQPTNQSTSKQIVPAQGWVFNEKGEVVLTAYDPNASNPQRTNQVSASCPAPF
ncbi:filamentous hemagglutinin N-terminal domain-containing protein [Fischerella thermalis]|uniref:two-partner secretion domain-containing protein n=3 Tax=Fischerella thermalis TaxID=372787 RepID=UPI000C7FE57A|nr:filamentous hemagglutinin N-terminal domain-containing protein [Fischerella thermalis]PLZ29753.1 filamentous hemagglutinin [Fischerella thermalis WC558]PLZ55557.1 filamentous hemagglutinin [Fischerella thermalis WC439]PLZ71571.1 filamentous hemagglutinin [Fischerella thermalis WC246]